MARDQGFSVQRFFGLGVSNLGFVGSKVFGLPF